jgi:hypothetical protein
MEVCALDLHYTTAMMLIIILEEGTVIFSLTTYKSALFHDAFIRSVTDMYPLLVTYKPEEQTKVKNYS